MTFVRLVLVLVVALGLFMPTVALAERSQGPIIELPEEVLRVRIRAPQAVYVVSRSRSAEANLARGQESFLDEVTESVRRDPF